MCQGFQLQIFFMVDLVVHGRFSDWGGWCDVSWTSSSNLSKLKPYAYLSFEAELDLFVNIDGFSTVPSKRMGALGTEVPGGPC